MGRVYLHQVKILKIRTITSKISRVVCSNIKSNTILAMFNINNTRMQQCDEFIINIRTAPTSEFDFDTSCEVKETEAVTVSQPESVNPPIPPVE